MTTWFEPTENTEEKKPQYPYNNATVTASGHSFEMDDTPGNERIRIQHRYGSYTEYQCTGNVTHKIVGQGYNIYMKDNNVVIQGKCNIEIYGDAEISCTNLTAHIKEDANIHVEGNLDVTCDGDIDGSCTGDITIAGDSVTLQAVDSVYVDCDLHVRGDIVGEQSVSAYGNLTAGGHCGITGSIQVMGIIPSYPGGVPQMNMINNMIGTFMVSPILSATAPITSIVGATSITGATSINGFTSVVGGLMNAGISALNGFTSIAGMKITLGMDRDMGGATGLATHTHPPIPSTGVG